MSIEVGRILEGKIVSIMPFGAFVSLGGDKTGLVHISEVSNTYIKDISNHFKIGDVVKVKVIKIDDKGKISLSIKKADEPVERKEKKDKKERSKPQPRQNVRPMAIDWSKPDASELSFEDKLSKFKQTSDEKMQSLRRSQDNKRSGGYRRGGGSY